MGAASARARVPAVGLWADAWSLEVPALGGVPAVTPAPRATPSRTPKPETPSRRGARPAKSRGGSARVAGSRPKAAPSGRAQPATAPRPTTPSRPAVPMGPVVAPLPGRVPRPAVAPHRKRRSRPAISPSAGVCRRRRTRLRDLAAPAIFLVLALGLLLVAPLVLNVASMQTEWRANRMDSRQDELAGQRSALRAQVAALSSSQRLQQEATAQGLMPVEDVDFLELSGGTPGASADLGAHSADAPATPSGG